MIRALFVALVLAVAAPAAADTIAVKPFDGPRARPTRNAVVKVLRRNGHKVVTQPRGDTAAVVIGKVRRVKKRWELEVRVETPDGAELVSTTVNGRRPPVLERGIRKVLYKRIGDELEAAKAAEPEPAPEPEPEPVAEREPEPEEAPGPAGDAGDDEVAASGTNGGSLSRSVTMGRRDDLGIELDVGLRVFSRELAYNDDLFEMMTEYDVAAAPAALLSGSYYPLSWLGITGHAAYTSEFKSRTQDAEAFPTTAYAYALGARYRWRKLDVGLDYGAQSFSIDDSAAQPKPAIPDVSYRYVRAAAAYRYPLTDAIGLGASAGYRHVLSSGEIESDAYFPRSSAAGIDASAWVRYHLTRRLSVSAGLDVERYFYSMNPEPGDPFIAGGAVDQFLGGWLAAGMAL